MESDPPFLASAFNPQSNDPSFHLALSTPLFGTLEKSHAGMDGKVSTTNPIERIEKHIQQRHEIIWTIGKGASGWTK
jgi:hypothetical protein